MKTPSKIITLLLSALTISLLASCGGGGGTTNKVATGTGTGTGGTVTLPSATAPSAPTGVIASSITTSANAITISWTAATDATYYQIYRNTSDSSASSTKITTSSIITASPYTDTGLSNGTFYYWVKACKVGDDCSGFSSSSSPITIAKYVKLANSGSPLTIQTATYASTGTATIGTKWSCVRDNSSNLIWETKTDDSSIHDKDNTYKWGGVGAETVIGNWAPLVDGSNTNSFCGASSGWRVPNRDELKSITTNSGNPRINTAFFPNAPRLSWSSIAKDINNAWFANFADGVDLFSSRDVGSPVRIVRTDN